MRRLNKNYWIMTAIYMSKQYFIRADVAYFIIINKNLNY